jgi:hypothetical protein
MRDWYELWDVDAGNMIGAFETEHDALVEVRALIDANGPDYALDLALASRREDGGEPIAEGAALARRAQTAVAPGDPGRRQA